MFLGIHLEKPKSRFSETLSYSKGVPVAPDIGCGGSAKEAIALLKSQNGVLNKDRLVKLTYGPKRPNIEKFTPHWAKMDSKVLCFDGIIKETVADWPSETHRIHYVKVYYYLENDTLRVVEPEIPNSTLCQGTLLRRDHYLHPSGKRNYSWKDLNIGNDLNIHGKEIHLIDCDAWTRQYLTDSGIEMRDPVSRPNDPHTEMKKNMSRRKEYRKEGGDGASLLNFYKNEGKVLKFYGIWKNDPQRPPAVRRIVLKYYLVDDTLAVFENYPPSSGWGPLLSVLQGPMDVASSGGSFMTLIRRQRVLLDRPKDVEKLPCYLEPRDTDDITWIKPEHLKTGEDLKILGKTFFLGKADEFTRHYYREHFGIELLQIEIMEKPKPLPCKIIPPHGIGKYEETLQDCFKPYDQPPKRIHHPIRPMPAEIVNTVLRFAAKMDTPRDTERIRRFTISFFMEDDTVKIHEEQVPNSGFGSGTFLKRCRLKKEVEGKVAKGAYYEAKDFYIGAKIKANGCAFILTDADFLVFKFMENHPEIYTDVCAEDQRKLADIANGRKELSNAEKMLLLEQLRNAVVLNYGCSAYPIEAIPDLGSGLAFKNNVLEKLYSGHLPIPIELLEKLVEAFAFEERTNVDEMKTFLLVSLGHKKDHYASH
ncbi:EF-hand domain-containing protein 1 [Argiope bruennichi]|uniref:EF-hand domain-containing protein 1 n=1 Tax=Argiope bruennichi TaxID=94029 RepID=A0A8T0ELY9_ARGBR|nr:EF-hand domain-containing protein 1 [Argiope bruennichi]